MSLKYSLKIFLIFFVLTLVSYFYVINGDFLGDDIARITLNTELNSYWSALTGGLKDRPLLMLIVTTIYKLFGAETVAFRLVSIIVHCLVALQINNFILEYSKDETFSFKKEIALGCSLLFVLHPLSNQSITTSIQLSVLLNGLFGILSLRYFLRGVSGVSDPNFLKSFGYLVLGILCKPNLVFLPVFYALFHSRIDGRPNTKLKTLALYFLACAIPLFFYGVLKANRQYSYSSFSYFLVQSEVLFTYFRLMLVPTGLKFLYDFDVPANLFFSFNWLYVLVHFAIVCFGFFKLPKKLFLLLALFYLSFIPESSFFPIDHLAFEHRTYFALAFFFIFIGTGIINLKPNETLRGLLKIGNVAICLLYLIFNQSRNVEIKRHGDWIIHTLENSTMYDFSNFYFSFLMARVGLFEKIEPIIRGYPQFKFNKDYDVLVDILEYYKQPKRKSYFIDKFFVKLENPKLKSHTRYFLNKIVLDDYVFKAEKTDDLIKVQRCFGRQMHFFMLNQLFKPMTKTYQTISDMLFTPENENKFKSTDYSLYLESKAVLTLFFNKKFENLEEDIKAELSKNPEQPVLSKLLADLQTQKISRN